ncbi:hypothetical protein CDAR_267331 [Caerostris darwini]|uniref:Uncharacterized protein n=1 Tax=Caerostris darwini TaxID=1538125 RepID=A0AAV4THU1_9ARAC|nr:hypothetical protein CDAR_267331 [Caerostris darwini]
MFKFLSSHPETGAEKDWPVQTGRCDTNSSCPFHDFALRSQNPLLKYPRHRIVWSHGGAKCRSNLACTGARRLSRGWCRIGLGLLLRHRSSVKCASGLGVLQFPAYLTLKKSH